MDRKMPTAPDLLFVYGTLRPSFGGESSTLVRHITTEGPATARGLLYDLGSYPGMIHGDGIVHGDVLRIANRADLEALDRYEECDGPWPLFQRERIEVLRGEGTPTLAWAYLYARSVDGATLIEPGDYLAWARRL
jgi:gamma-glutamylcyclotransferase (GGCT)/AIG2-like uncharacterized protein YtfP